MGYTYTPTYYSGLQDTIASLCKSFLPFPFRGGRRLTADQAAARRHAEQLKWQQESFHRILHLSGLHREGIVPASDVAAFRASMLATLVAPPAHPDQPAVLRDKLLFLQELLYSKCISAAEYNSSKAPLVQRLAALGVVVECPDAEGSAEEWSEIDLRDPPPPDAAAGDKPKHKAFITPWKSRSKKEQDANSNASRPPLAQVDQNHPKNASVLMAESSLSEAVSSGKPEKGKRRHLAAMFHSSGNGSENKEPAGEEGADDKETVKGKKKSSWGFDGLKKWKKTAGGGNEEVPEHTPAAPPRSSHSECRLEASPMAASGPDAKRAKKKLHPATGDDSASELLHDKVLVENTKKELSRIRAKLSSTNRNLNFSAWCEQHGDGVVTAAKKGFKEHVEEMEKQRDIAGGEGWATFEDINFDENFNPRASSRYQSDSVVKGKKVNESLTSSFTNPFYDEKNPFLSTIYN
ncbi:uncharacterized protein LOC133901930 isoform X2 [Phragmites australis]|uniref:uncharacterized protein LOC133901930 isoform X2 n=1 Tax=Phragmites australis TaxID=29695 RepID=UPI002D7796D7|nr:uncharacterized protein LOC133901930 isoform X2 [Phragmites australis]